MADQARTAITELRELVRGIRPPVLQDAGLVAALETQLASLPVDVRLESRGASGRRWPPTVEAAAYFMVKEAVTNAVKHAPGATLTIVLASAEEDLAVEVRDDGPGVGESAHTGRGLTGLRDRVESLGGVFTVEQGAGGGRVQARIPGREVARR